MKHISYIVLSKPREGNLAFLSLRSKDNVPLICTTNILSRSNVQMELFLETIKSSGDKMNGLVFKIICKCLFIKQDYNNMPGGDHANCTVYMEQCTNIM